MPIHTEQADEKYVRIIDTYGSSSAGGKVYYGLVKAQTVPDNGDLAPREYFVIRMPDGKDQIHPKYACTEITEKEYFLAVLGGNV